MEVNIKGVIVECLRGDISKQHGITAVVNAANAMLRPGGGVAGAIHRAAGPELEKECRKYAPIKPGQAVITGGYNLPNKYVIHCLGPVYGVDHPEEKLLADCYRNALLLADEKEIDSIAFPAISTGAFGYPVREAAEVSLSTVIDIIPKLKHVKRIRFVLYSENDLKIHEETLKRILKEKGIAG